MTEVGEPVMRNSTDEPSHPVALVQTDASRVKEDVRRVMELAKWRDHLTPGEDVSLKPNLGWDKLIPGAISASWVIEGVIETIQGYVGKIYLVESDQVVVDVERVLRLTRLDKVCQKYDVTWVNMSKGKFVQLQDEERLVLRDIRIPEILTRTQLITIPTLKTHNKTTVSGALKNQWGCLETLRHNFHPVLPQALVDINQVAGSKFAVMDGTIGLEGNGPKSGSPVEMNVLLASANLVGLDMTAARLMGFEPNKIPHIVLCAQHGIGRSISENEVAGDSPASLCRKFVPAKHNPVSFLEFTLRRPLVERLVFKTPLLGFFAWGARRYYDLWDLTVGRKIRNSFFESTGYRDQWV